MINNLLEIIRSLCVAAGLFFAFSAYSNGQPPAEQFGLLFIWVVPSLAGLTGIEGVFFGEKAREQSGYGGSGAYQRQSGFNNLALALTAILVYLMGWGIESQAAVMMVLLIFLTLSAGNHAYSAIKEGNRRLKNFSRPIMTALLLAFVLPFMVRAL